MSELDKAHREAQARAADLDAAQEALIAATDELTRLRRLRAAAARGADHRDPDTAGKLAALDAEIAALEQKVEQQRRRRTDSRAALAEAVTAFGKLADPTREVGNLDGETPLLLLPVRIETRFKDGELLVRAYPDEWAVDTFEPKLSDGEVDSARRFWASTFRAGGDEDLRRAAWRGIVSSHGSGRAGWIIEQDAPVNPGDEPVRTGAGEVILAVAADLPLSTEDTKALAAYWEGLWRKGGDPDGSLADALTTALGADRATTLMALPPAAFDDEYPNVDRAGEPVRFAYCQLPTVDTKTSSWTTPPKATVLPDRLVLLGYQGNSEVLHVVGAPIPPALAVGPDPAAGPSDQFRLEDGELIVPDELRWMVDFDEAVRVGMGFRVPLLPATMGGFDRLLVVGLRVAAKPEEDQAALETLLTDHRRSRKGLSLLAQGTPTNNTEADPAGFDRLDDPDLSYPLYLGGGAGLGSVDSWDAKQDGQWLAECLGLDPATFAKVPGAAGTDQAEARAMNVALWPATFGYFLDTMMHPLFEGPEVDDVRGFFLDFVSGRGRVPALRIGRQPYGILPTTALSRLSFRDDKLLFTLGTIVDRMAADWAPLVDAVPHVHGGGEPHQTLLDVVALHPASVEFHQRYAESVEDIFNRVTFDNLGPNFLVIWEALGSVLAGRQLLADLGYPGPDSPDILGKLFHGKQHRLKGPVIDDRPLSEQALVRSYCDDGRNYLHWLVDAARASLDTLRREDGFTAGKAPTALLYLLLRHALLLSWWDAGLRFRLDAGLLDRDTIKASRQEPAFIHVTGDGPSESRWGTLYGTAAVITGSERMTLAEFMPQLFDRPPARHLTEVIEAIKRLAELPTARLERLLAEHLDCASYRLDAWRLGLVHQRLLDLRQITSSGGTPRRGVHLGVYGWLEDVRPEAHHLEKVELPEELVKAFGKDTDPPLMRDSSNGGFVHAPSLNHAATAAVLRSGFLANTASAHPDAMAVNLSSERMRLAISILQGIRNGQTLGALLGYRFERGLHDRHGLAEVDSFIFPLRKAFPAPGDRDGRQAVDGLALARHIQQTGNHTYPFGRADLPAAPGDKQTAIDLEVVRLLDVHDAVADLVLAEGVHQAVLGNFDRVAATLDSVGSGGFPTEPAVLETPHNGITVTHRFGLHLRTGLNHNASPVAGVSPTPRSHAEPAVNEFLAAMLPAPATVVATVTWTDPDGTARSRLVSQQQLGLQPIDLLHLLHLQSESALGELDERILWRVMTDEGLRPDVLPVVRFTQQVPGHRTFFEIAPLVGHLRTLLTRSRPLRPTDVLPPADARSGVDAGAVHADKARVQAVRTALSNHRTALAGLVTDLDTLLGDPVAHRAELLAQVDTLTERTVAALLDSGRFGLQGSGSGAVIDGRRALFTDLRAAAAELTGRWQTRLTEADAFLASDNALPVNTPDTERIRVLLLAQQQVSAQVTDPVPTDATAYRTQIDGQRAQFASRLAAFSAVATSSTSLHAALASTAALLPIDAFDSTPFNLAEIEDRVIDFCDYLRGRVTSLITDADARITAVDAKLAEHDTAAPGQPKVDALTAAITALLGPDTLFVPEFQLAPGQGDEWEAALSWSRTGSLTAHLSTRDFPVDDWLHGVARVREKVHAWEQVQLLAFAAGRPEPEIWPIQVPHAGEPWLALELPAGFSGAGERVLYTAHYPSAFDKTAAQAGLLVDEWTEVIPGDTATTGVTFNYDSPDSEPPQAMLLVVPPVRGAGWQWADVVDALHETLGLARLRAVEPDQVATTRYASFLPATVSAATVRGLSIAANFALNNDLLTSLRADHV